MDARALLLPFAPVFTGVNRVRRAVLGRARGRGLTVERGRAYGPDPEQIVDVWRPAAAGPAPTVVLLHGGGWVEGSRRDFASLAPAFAAAGVLAVAADYRLGPRTPWPGARDDVGAVLDGVARLGGDPARVVLWGHSAGGHLALTAARSRVGTSDRGGVVVPVGVVALGAPADLRLLSAEETSLARRVFGARDLAEVSPACLGVGVTTLLVHGTADAVCAIAGARALTAAEPDHVTLIEVPGGDHGLRWPPPACLRARRAAFAWVCGRLAVTEGESSGMGGAR